ncbi:MAG: hypothetical protein A3I11_08110 [Elusimicrobia bacterium RIFCSPLOWO2_02_FULL_39_32]|nr:MAG: hypothetical protein A2034_03055 [Elusimicrobia bacterium GWA2_38_7]OGR79235.1 MAG: hypothetical protein A3B80_08370 [Elusimicrobia bacterium RIFCSPHIGHO2_02_FULL_39_36]OGR93136.1 MAG: hypothetical protein A3I11_08110 [Elusimicrobia bacterium RIFCSPLOWO2_02_FULL_39_32]OGR99361.1 MAG: hypothetical protein A3G85_06555 [Elusimicrobia bacterium RIFCSPLOWO2_12_FULL_39_28]
MNFEVHLLPIEIFKPHEEVQSERVLKIKKEILDSEKILQPLWIEKGNFVVLNGHHRLSALKELNCFQVPCFLFNYFSDEIQVQVCSGSSLTEIDKHSIIQAALTGNLYPPRSSFHILNIKLRPNPTPLTDLQPEVSIFDPNHSLSL